MTLARFLLLAFFLLIASWLQASLSSQIAIFHARPDFVLTTMISVCILTGAANGMLLSTWGGFLTAVLAGYNYGSVLISRLVTGVLSGLLQGQIIQDSLFIPVITTFLGTWICEGVYFLMAPNLHFLHWWLRMVFGEALYNSILSIFIYRGLRLLNFGSPYENGYNPFIENW
jgi:LytS/YehU family sensor histidine kinase